MSLSSSSSSFGDFVCVFVCRRRPPPPPFGVCLRRRRLLLLLLLLHLTSRMEMKFQLDFPYINQPLKLMLLQ